MRATALTVIFLLVSFSASAMPASFYQAMANMDTSSYLCVQNYDAGASVTESYRDFEHLEKETQISSQSFHPSGSGTNISAKGNGTLDASISSSVVGKAHIAWQSKDSNPGIFGRYPVYGLMTEDLSGVFSIERLIHLQSNLTCWSPGSEWLMCG